MSDHHLEYLPDVKPVRIAKLMKIRIEFSSPKLYQEYISVSG